MAAEHRARRARIYRLRAGTEDHQGRAAPRRHPRHAAGWIDRACRAGQNRSRATVWPYGTHLAAAGSRHALHSRPAGAIPLLDVRLQDRPRHHLDGSGSPHRRDVSRHTALQRQIHYLPKLRRPCHLSLRTGAAGRLNQGSPTGSWPGGELQPAVDAGGTRSPRNCWSGWVKTLNFDDSWQKGGKRMKTSNISEPRAHDSDDLFQSGGRSRRQVIALAGSAFLAWMARPTRAFAKEESTMMIHMFAFRWK